MCVLHCGNFKLQGCLFGMKLLWVTGSLAQLSCFHPAARGVSLHSDDCSTVEFIPSVLSSILLCSGVLFSTSNHHI